VQEGEPAFGSSTSATQTDQSAHGAAGLILRTRNGPLPARACAARWRRPEKLFRLDRGGALGCAGAMAAAGVVGLALPEAGVQRPPARAHLVIAPALRHPLPPLLEISAAAWKLEIYNLSVLL
jgi:hypothetical protein